MSFDLCTVKQAENPYYIKSVGIRIWSIEELCFFLHNNIWLIDKTIVDEKLVEWIRDELELKPLARKLADALERPDSDVSYFIMPIFAQTGYLNAYEQRQMREELTRVQVKAEDEREKIRADYLVKSGRYEAAITSYRKLLSDKSLGNLGAGFYSGIWNNLGCAYALEFRFEEAAEAFLTGWKLSHSRELMRRYVSVLPMYLSGEEYKEKLRELGADPLLISKIQEYNLNLVKEVEEKVNSRIDTARDPEKELEDLMEEYRRGAFG